MSYGDFDTAEQLIEALTRDIEVLRQLEELCEQEERDLAEIAAAEEFVTQAIDLGTHESLQSAYDFVKEFTDTLQALDAEE